MIRFPLQRRLLQIAVGLAAAVPVGVGLYGVVGGLPGTGVFLDSHHRYLSGLLVGIGLAYWWTIPRIERMAGPFRLLTLIVILGGLARLGASLSAGRDLGVVAALAMELVIAPLLSIWREKVQRMDPNAPPRYGGPWG